MRDRRAPADETDSVALPHTISLVLIPLAFAAGVLVLVRSMSRMRPLVQLAVLAVLGLSVGFTFLVMVQLPEFPRWLGISMMVVALVAAPFATRSALRSVAQEDERRSRGE